MSTKKTKAAKAASPKTKKAPTENTETSGLVSLDGVELRQSARNRVGRFDQPALQLIEALEAGKTNLAYCVELGSKQFDKVKTYYYNAMRKSLAKHRKVDYRITLRTDPVVKKVFISIAERGAKA